MRTIDTQVLVIGGGPGGTSAAITLAKAGIDCTLVEKATIPHEKLCGGLYTQKTHHALQKLLTAEEYETFIAYATCNVAHQIEFYRGTKLLVTVDDDYPMTVVSRERQDEWLFRHAGRLGARTIDGDGVLSIDFGQRLATLRSGQQIRYRFIIAADGASSRTEHLLCAYDKRFPAKGKNVYGIGLTVSKDELPDVDDDKLRIYFDLVPSGYSALFSFGDKVRFGLAKGPDEKIDLKTALFDFAHKVGIKHPENYPVQGCVAPQGNVMKRPIWQDHVFFVGDAAGFCEMMTAEGICYAMMSGTDAAESIAEGLRQADAEKAAAALYWQCARRYIKIVDDSRIHGWCFNNQLFKRAFYWRAPMQPGWMSYFYSRKIEEGSTLPYFRLRWDYHVMKKKQK